MMEKTDMLEGVQLLKQDEDFFVQVSWTVKNKIV